MGKVLSGLEIPRSVTFLGNLQPHPVGAHLQGRVTGKEPKVVPGNLN